jgi:hypothetical protein
LLARVLTWLENFGEVLMREWLLAIIPAAAIVYFLMYPDQFSKIVAWLAQLFR